MKIQQTLAQTWKRRRDSDFAEAKRLITERGVGGSKNACRSLGARVFLLGKI